MKIFAILISTLLIGYIFAEIDKECDDYEGLNSKECKNQKVDGKAFDDEEKKYCCFIEYTDNNNKKKGCWGISQKMYDDVEKAKNESNEKMKNEGEGEFFINKIDCNSFYLKFSLLSLILILL